MVAVNGDRNDPKNKVIAGTPYEGVVFDGVGSLVIPGPIENIYGTANLINKQFLIDAQFYVQERHIA